MADFNKSIEVILKHEGTPTNHWVCDPRDPGGETQWGISMLFIKNEKITPQELGIANFNPGCLKAVTLDTVKNIYKKYFWDRYHYEKINDNNVATKIFDAAVNMGPKRGHILAQRAANDCGQKISIDGIIGPKTIEAINNCQPSEFLNQMIVQMSNYYNNLVKQKPQLQCFLKNWLYRAKWTN